MVVVKKSEPQSLRDVWVVKQRNKMIKRRCLRCNKARYLFTKYYCYGCKRFLDEKDLDYLEWIDKGGRPKELWDEENTNGECVVNVKRKH